MSWWPSAAAAATLFASFLGSLLIFRPASLLIENQSHVIQVTEPMLLME